MLMRYLPAQLSEIEIRDLINAAIAETAAAGPQDRGKVMGIIMPKIKGKADGGVVSKIVGELLG